MIPSVGGENLEGCVRALLLRLAEIDPDAVHPGVRPLLVAPYLLEQSRSVPIAPLGGAEAKLLESTCKQSIVALEGRLAEGERLLAAVEEPGKLADGARIERQIIEVVSREGLTSRGAAPASGGRRARLVGQLMALLFPTLRDLAPFLLLLGLRTGLNPESLDMLTVDAFEDLGNGHVRLRWFKARGGGLEADTFSGRGQWSAGGLLRRAVAATARARRIAVRTHDHGLPRRWRISRPTTAWCRSPAFVSARVCRFGTSRQILRISTLPGSLLDPGGSGTLAESAPKATERQSGVMAQGRSRALDLRDSPSAAEAARRRDVLRRCPGSAAAQAPRSRP